MGNNIIQPPSRLHEGSISGCEVQESARSNVRNRGPLENHQTSPGCGNLILTPSHTTLGETSVRSPWTVAERASSTRICLTKLTLNLGQAPIRKQCMFAMVGEVAEGSPVLCVVVMVGISAEGGGLTSSTHQSPVACKLVFWNPMEFFAWSMTPISIEINSNGAQ